MINVRPLWTPTSPRIDWMSADLIGRTFRCFKTSLIMRVKKAETHSIWNVTAYREGGDSVLSTQFFGRVLCSGLGMLGTVVYFIGHCILVVFFFFNGQFMGQGKLFLVCVGWGLTKGVFLTISKTTTYHEHALHIMSHYLSLMAPQALEQP